MVKNSYDDKQLSIKYNSITDNRKCDVVIDAINVDNETHEIELKYKLGIMKMTTIVSIAEAQMAGFLNFNALDKIL